MLPKKSGKADLERKRFAFFQIGLIVAGACVLVAFEYSSMHTAPKMVQLDENTYEVWNPILPNPDDLEKPQEQKQQPAPTVYLAPIDTVVISSRPLPTPGFITTQPVIPVIGDPDPGYGPIGPLSAVDIIDVPDVDPSYPGGELARMQFLQKMIVYPELAREMDEQGTVYVEFVVNTDGSICNVLVKNDINKELANEAMRVVKLMPNWIPGEQAGKKVRVRYTIPINFVIK